MPNENIVPSHWLISLDKLDDQQKYIAALKPEESFIVEGCAGSGKSVLAMIKFNQLCQSKLQPVYATMMRGLTDTIITEVLESNDDGMKNAKEYVQLKTKKKTSNLNHGKPWYYTSNCIGTCYMLPCINSEYKYPLKGDHLVLDECQDLSYDDFKKIITNGGYKSICWYGDDDQQLCDNIGGAGKHVRIKEIFDKCFNDSTQAEKWLKLVWNYRISPNVAKFLDEFQKVIKEERKLLALSAKGKRTDKPFLCGYDSFEAEINSMIQVIENRKWQTQTGHRTAILVGGSNQQVEDLYLRIYKKFEAKFGREFDIQRRRGPTNNNTDDWVTADPSSPIIVSTPLQSKGCQFDSVFVLANTFGKQEGRIMSNQDLNAIHVAMTRSGGDLFVFYTGTMPPAFNQIPVSFYESSLTSSANTTDDLGLE